MYSTKIILNIEKDIIFKFTPGFAHIFKLIFLLLFIVYPPPPLVFFTVEVGQ